MPRNIQVAVNYVLRTHDGVLARVSYRQGSGSESKPLARMDRAKSECPEGIGSVKAAISLYGERINGRNPDKNQSQIHFHEDSPSKTMELHLAAQAESELHMARTAAEELARQIEETDAKARAHKLELQLMRRPDERGKEGRNLAIGAVSEPHYADMIRELDNLKQQLGRLKLDVASASAEKAKAEMEAEAANAKTKSYLCTAEELTKQLEEANEEHVLVEIARIEAERESRQIAAQREAEAAEFANNMEATKRRIKQLRKELSHAKELEGRLAVTNSDVNVLQSEMELVRAMERSYLQKDEPVNESECRSSLQTAEAELKVAKKELASIKEEGFHFMASMDLTREELRHATEEANRLKDLERKADSTIQSLHSRLLKTKSKYEFASQANERAEAIVSNLSAALQQLHTEIEASRKEEELISEEATRMKKEVEKTDLDLVSAEERLRAAMRELAAAKASEALALNKLRNAAERAVKARASSTPRSSTITISKSEYDYLSHRAAAAQVVADKKVEAARAWIEALKAGEKEMAMKTEFIERDIKRSRALEEQQLREMESSLVARKATEEEMVVSNLRPLVPTPRTSMKEDRAAAAPRRVKVRRLSASNGTRPARSPLFTIRKKRKVIPNLVRLLIKQKMGRQK